MLEEKKAVESITNQTTKKQNHEIIGFGYAIAALIIIGVCVE